MLKAAITTLLLGSASVAAADPVGSFYGDRVESRFDHDSVDRRFGSNRRPVLLADNVMLETRGRPQFIALDARQNIRRLRLDLQQGRAFVNSIHVVFDDGHRETIAVNRMLSRRDPSLIVDLPHGGVQGIFIDTEQTRFGRGGGLRRQNTAIVDVVGARGLRG